MLGSPGWPSSRLRVAWVLPCCGVTVARLPAARSLAASASLCAVESQRLATGRISQFAAFGAADYTAQKAAVQSLLEQQGYDFAKQTPPLASILGIIALLCGLAAYWAEARGGPPTYTAEWGGSESHVQRLHAGEAEYMEEASPRFVACVADSFDEAGVPDDPRVRQAITDYITWAATGPFQAWGRSKDDVPDGLPLGHWDWDGPT